MQIRDLSILDYQDVDRLMAILHQAHVDGRPDMFVPMEHIYSLEKYRPMVEDRDCILLGAFLEEKMVGLCIAKIRRRSFMVDQCSAYVDDLVVDPKFRRRGIATRLLEEMENRSIQCGAKRLDLSVWSFNREALLLYRSLGMEEQRYVLEKKL